MPIKRSALIVIGAASGGFGALCRLLTALPADFGLPVMVVYRQLGRSTESVVAELDHISPMAVRIAGIGERPEAGHAYLAPTGRQLLIGAHGGIDLETAAAHATDVSDRLFKSAALVYRDGTVGVVLSGEGDDGTQGLIAIKAVGGLSLVQSPVEAVNPSMPMHALMDDDPDQVLLLDHLARRLAELAR